ncbi:MAG: Jag N-terminal domain-containing protein [Campylobacter sp.]|nr:Jag N-terminal domain-containing protein [Campylobacter sp.]
MRIEAKSLQEAFSKAALECDCSVTELKYEIIQNPTKGFLGLFKKTAIIEIKNQPTKSHTLKSQKQSQSHKSQKDIKDETPAKGYKITKNPTPKNSSNLENHSSQKPNFEKNRIKTDLEKTSQPKFSAETSEIEKPHFNSYKKYTKKYRNEVSDEALKQIELELKELFAKTPFIISTIEIKKFEDHTILIFIDGDDAALLIGKDGRRYKAIYYMLYSWVNLKFNLNVRLEISKFLQSQELMIAEYLKSVIQRVNLVGKATTKPLDGILIDIALKQLRDEFPNKYVAAKHSKDGKYILISEFKK